MTGSVRPHAHLRISKFTQHFIDVLDLNLSPLDYFLSLWLDMTREEGRKFLGRFGISGSVQTQGSNLRMYCMHVLYVCMYVQYTYKCSIIFDNRIYGYENVCVCLSI